MEADFAAGRALAPAPRFGTSLSYVLVDADNEDAAREFCMPKFHELSPELRAKLGRDVPVNICTVRPASEGEIETAAVP